MNPRPAQPVCVTPILRRRPILLVDDDTTVRESICRLLIGEGYDVITASSGKWALDYLDQRLPALVITDLCMAVVTGWDLIRYVTDQHRTVPIFVVSAYPFETLREEGTLIAGYFEKPLDIEHFLTAIHRQIGPSQETTV